MTSKLHQRVTSVLAGLAIVALLAIIIVVWIQVSHGAFRHNHRRTFNVTEHRSAETAGQERSKEFVATSKLDDFGKHDTEFVKPLKISPPPLHDHDIIYDQMHNAPEQPPLRHHSGHFRHKTTEIWDPHPQYEIHAFGHRLHLNLAYNDRFVSPNLQITRTWNNVTQRVRHDRKSSGCYYTGKVVGELTSDVSVSLCNGMTGYIRTSEGNYYIEPVESFHNGSSILHRIKKITHKYEETNHVDLGDGAQCETTEERRTIINDDYETVDDHDHLITKREILIDDLSSERLGSRTTRAISWSRKNLNLERARTKRMGNQTFYIETMIVADRKMAKYHKTDDDLIHYILTLMSHVALLFKHATIGNPISIAVVQIYILQDTAFTSTTSEEMLRKFCEWQKKQNWGPRHDTALLLTRDPICKNSTIKGCSAESGCTQKVVSSQVCNTLGVAEVGSMCSSSSSCAIVRDKGLSTSYTIAHELGHVLSMPHDDDDMKCALFHKGMKANNIMSKMLQNDTKPWMWSPCSKHYVTEFLDSRRSHCLQDAPSVDKITSNFSKVFPGEVFEINKQCELEFGNGSKLCSYMLDEVPPCESLWCSTEHGEETGCRTQHMPWADGTSCGYKRWCHRGQCISVNRTILTPISGGWGQWQEWGPCTRTCGGGIRLSKRNCDKPLPQHGGPYCVGPSVRYESCNYQPCDATAVDFREIQCAEFNGRNLGIPGLPDDVKWVPKYGISQAEDLCKLYCRVKHSHTYYGLRDKVIDGSKCGLNSVDICVNGMCKPGGCDNRLDSKIVVDECGICGGDSSQCQEITGTFYVRRDNGYQSVVTIPKGSSNIKIQQRSYQNATKDDYFLALLDGETNEYILNGNFVVSAFEKNIFFNGMTIIYSGADKVVEQLTTPKNKKLTKDLKVEVLAVAGNFFPPDITYKYIIDKHTSPKFGRRIYDEHWTKCDKICGGKQKLVCVEFATDLAVSDDLCSEFDNNGPVLERPCNTHCQLVWKVARRGQCSTHCGKGKVALFHNCVKIDLNQKPYDLPREHKVDAKHCLSIGSAETEEDCEGPCDPTRWDYGDWTECTKTCGTGHQFRNAECIISSSGQILHDSLCNESEKVTEQVCNVQQCPTWSLGEWTPCSVSCGRGYRTKPYYCQLAGRIYSAHACDPEQKPIVEKNECNLRPCVHWFTGTWSECSASCGDGIQVREVLCQTLESGQPDEKYCSDILKPNRTRICVKKDCDILSTYKHEYDFEDNYIHAPIKSKFRWITGAWNQCSKSCDGGVVSRMVICRDEYGEENEFACNSRERPVNRIECNPHPCPKWNFGAWSNCDESCEQYRQVSCQNSTGSIVEDHECDLTSKPYSRTKCSNDLCSADFNRRNSNASVERRYRWKLGKWSPCSKSCGKGFRTRQVRCKDTVNDVSVVDQYCTPLKKPKTSKPCERNNCDYIWVEGVWSQCTKTCGEGARYRNVTCHKVLPGGYVDPVPLPEIHRNKRFVKDYCDVYTKPQTTAACLERNCDDQFSWISGPWGQCSHPCGRKGRETRHLYCVARDGKKMHRSLCPRSLKPARKRKCNQKRCLYGSCKEVKHALKTNQNKDYMLLIGGKPALVHCYKMDTREPEEYISLQGGSDNFAEIYDKRLREPNSCPNYGQRRDNCDCVLVGPDRSGLTNFWKVRLNITTLRIIGNDFTFSSQTKGTRIPYGTAGDCYSSLEGCPQGRFSVDLTDTSFRLSKSVRWVKTGRHASLQLNAGERRASGRCGGYCGNCMPDPQEGLAVEVT